MDDLSPRRPLTPAERWISGIFLAVILGLFVVEVFHDYQPVKLSALLIVLFWIPLLALHEAGHALAAALLGWYVGEVVIGFGRILCAFRIGTAAVEVRWLPIEGFVKCVPRNLRMPRLKSVLIYFAGPGIELLVALVILALIGPDRLFSRSEDYWLIAWQSLAVAATAQAVLNLMPASVQKEGEVIASDGLGIIRSFMQPEGYYAGMIGQTYNEQERDWESYDPADWWKRGP
jgi:hypothetical protein